LDKNNRHQIWTDASRPYINLYSLQGSRQKIYNKKKKKKEKKKKKKTD